MTDEDTFTLLSLSVFCIYLWFMPWYAILLRVILTIEWLNQLLFAYDIAQLLNILGFVRCNHWRFLCVLACFVWLWLSIYCNFDNFVCRLRNRCCKLQPYVLKGHGTDNGTERGRSSYTRGVW